MNEWQEQEKKNLESSGDIAQAIDTLKQNKPNDRSEKDRYYAITITELEKAYALFRMYVLGQ